MLNTEIWYEIYDTVRKNKLRTFLTGISIAWGIFMLIILLGAGQGLRNAFEGNMKDDAINSIWIRPGQTSVPYKGMKSGRYLQLKDEDLDYLLQHVDGIEYYTARYNRWSQIASYKDKTGTFRMRGVHPGHQYVENTLMNNGRFINQNDVNQYRKSVVIGEKVRSQLFGEVNPIGEYINMHGVLFKVVGVFRDEGSEGEEEVIYIPVTTAQRVFNGANRVHQIMVTTGDLPIEETEKMTKEIASIMSERHQFDPEDERAMYISNQNEQFQTINAVFDGITWFVWIIGVMTIIAGIVGIGNIMLIVVKERTREIGVRKSIGATPYSIVKMIVMESVIVTSIFGYFGLLGGIFLLENLKPAFEGSDVLTNPEVDLSIAATALCVLVVAGTMAGLFPAVRAANIKPIEALKDE